MDGKSQLLVLVEHLKRNRFEAILTKNAHDARDKILEAIPLQASVGLANSVTVRQTGVIEVLRDRGNKIIDPISPIYGLAEFHENSFQETMKNSLEADVFLAGTNAVTEDGKLVNIDGTGNRVGGIMLGPGKSIVIIGRNKIVKNVDDAIYRIKNQISPTLARRRQLNLPCAKVGRCVDCQVPERACNITVILEKKPAYKDLTVIVVDEDLGLGWDTDWPEERINDIRRKYEQFDWPYTSAHRRYKAAHIKNEQEIAK
jgi:hypothetical protein